MPAKPTYEALERQVAALQAKLQACQRKCARGPALALFPAADCTPLLHAIVHNAPSVIYVKDTAGRFILVNQNFCDIFQLNEKDVLGKTPTELFPADIARQHLANDRQIVQTRLPATFCERAVLPEGPHEYLSVKFPIFDESGAVIAVGGISTDISERVRAEEQLRLSKERFRLAFETSPDAINLNRMADGVYLDINQGFTRLMGYTREDVIGKSSLALNIWHNPADRLRLVEGLQKAGTINDLEAEFVRKDGAVGVGLMSARVLEIDNEKMILSVTRDITGSKQAEASLRASELKFRNIIDASPMGIHLYELQGDNRLIFTGANATASRLLGIDHEPLIGKAIEEAFPGLVTTEIPARYREAARIGKVWRTEQFDYHHGRIKGAFDVVAFQTEPRHMAVLFNEITARKQAEMALKESESRYRAFFEQGPDGIVILDSQTLRPVQFNDQVCQMLGYSREAFAKLDLSDIEAPQTSARRETLAANLSREGYGNFEIRLLTNEGEERDVNITAQRIELAGHPVYHCMLRDITEKTKLQQQLQQAQKFEAVGTLAGGIAHDFNNLLMGIQGRASLLAVDFDPADARQEHINAIAEYVRSATNLTKQLLGFARGGKYEVKPLDLNRLLRASAGMFGRTRKEIGIHIKTPPQAVVVVADRAQIEQVLLNLYVNAWQAMPDGGELFLATAMMELDEAVCGPHQLPAGRYAKITVTDTGIGIDGAIRHRIFDPFFTTKEKDRGTGLGLASAYGIVKNHGGFISVYSEVGHGTTFNIYLPTSAQEIQTAPPDKRRLVKGTETILLVDDEEMILEVGAAMLAKLGYRVVRARGGPQAVEMLQGQAIDLIILDLIMPGLDGGKTFDRLRQLQATIPVILSSGYSINGQATEIMSRGCNGFIQKPFNIVELSQKIREVLDHGKPPNPAPGG
jgi:two-component system cell cycle sensor histidine kinase/response regulator CckA